jgi:hypothetical protein
MKLSTLQTLLEKIKNRYGDIDVMTRIPICRYESTFLSSYIEMRVTKPESNPCLVLEG